MGNSERGTGTGERGTGNGDAAPPIAPRDKPISPDAPEMARGGAPTEKPGWLEVPARGMKFSRFSTPTRRTLLAKVPERDRNPAKLHMVTVTPSLIVKGDFEAGYYQDGELKFALCAHSVTRAEKCAIAAVKAYLRDSSHRGRRKGNRNIKED